MRVIVTAVAVTAFALSLYARPVQAQSASSGQSGPPKKIQSIEGITEYQLENGMKVLLFPDPSKETVTVNLTLLVGSRHEGYGEAGMAHLLEHMLFKGTPTHENIPKLLQDRGARFNGTTSLDRTNYYETLPASDENLEFALKLEADRMINSNILAEDLESEMTVVRNEFERSENSPISVLMSRVTSASYVWHNYGQSTIGNRADIERVPIKSLRAFYRKYYQPDNAVLIVSGKFDADTALSHVGNYFGGIAKPERVLAATYTEEPAQDGERRVILRRVGDVPVVATMYHICSGAHPDYPAVDVLSSVLAADESGRLYKALVNTKRTPEIYGSSRSLHDPGMMSFYAPVATGNDPRDVLATMTEVTETLSENPVTAEEVERARTRLLKFREKSAERSQSLAIQLSEWAAQGDWRLFFLYRDRLEKVTVEDVNRVAATYLRQSNRTSGIYIPTTEAERTPIPATPDLAEMIGDYKGREAIAQGEAFDVSPMNIESRTQRSVLPSGVKVAVLAKKTRGGTVDLTLTLRYGTEKSLNGMATVASMLPALMERGTKNLSYQDIRDQLDEYRSTMSASGNPGTATFRIQSKRENLPAVLEVLRQVLREPSFPEKELEQLRASQLSQLKQSQSEPNTHAQTAVSRKISPFAKGHPRYAATTEEKIEMLESVSVADIKKLYSEMLNGQTGELSIVGDFDAESTMQIVNRSLADWKAPVAYEYVPNRGDFTVEPGYTQINTPDKANAMYFAATVFPIRDDNPDYPALMIGNFILGSSGLSSRLGDRVRQQDGLSYSIGSGMQASAKDERAAFYVYAITNPVNGEKVRAAIKEEIDRLQKDGITPEELVSAKKGYLQQQQVGRTRDGRLAGALSSSLFVGRTMQFTADQEAKVSSLTVDEVNAAIRKYLSHDKLFVAMAGDFDKATDEPSDEKVEKK